MFKNRYLGQYDDIIDDSLVFRIHQGIRSWPFSSVYSFFASWNLKNCSRSILQALRTASIMHIKRRAPSGSPSQYSVALLKMFTQKQKTEEGCCCYDPTEMDPYTYIILSQLWKTKQRYDPTLFRSVLKFHLHAMVCAKRIHSNVIKFHRKIFKNDIFWVNFIHCHLLVS